MSVYLLPFNSGLTIEEKRRIFEIRNRMTEIPFNFGNKEEKCICNEIETMEHIYSCNIINKTKPEGAYTLLYHRNQIEIFRKFEKNMEIRQQIKKTNNLPCDPHDPVCYQYRFGQAGTELCQAQLKLASSLSCFRLARPTEVGVG